MKILNTALATSLTLVLGTAAAAQTTTPSTTTQTTTTQTQPTTTVEPPSTTQTTTTQPTTTPGGQPATTTQTTTTESQPTMTPEGQPATTTTETTTETQVTAATADDIKKGVSVFDQTGALVGKVDSVKGDAAIVSTGKARAEIPLSSFGKNDKGLVVSITKADLDAQAKTKAKPKK